MRPSSVSLWFGFMPASLFLFRRCRGGRRCGRRLDQIVRLHIEIVEYAFRTHLDGWAVRRLRIDALGTLVLRPEGDSQQVVRTLPEYDLQAGLVETIRGERPGHIDNVFGFLELERIHHGRHLVPLKLAAVR